MATSIFVGNLPWAFTSRDLEELFNGHGEVAAAEVLVDTSGRSRGFGFVEMASDDAAGAAITRLDRLTVAGRSIRVAPSRRHPREVINTR